MDKIKVANIISTINDSPSGGFVGISGYKSENGDVVSVVGQVGVSYGTAKTLAIQALQEAIESDDFECITVKGKCYKKDGVWNVRARSNPLEDYEIDYSVAEVKEMAETVLSEWENPVKRANNKLQLSEKENGLAYNIETHTLNMTLMVLTEDYDTEASKLLKEGKEKKVKASAPESKLKEKIRKQFMKKVKSYTLTQGKFTTLSLNGQKIQSDNIDF